MIKYILMLWIFSLVPIFNAHAQKQFLIEADSVTRSYLLTATHSFDAHNQPLVIILHENGNSATKAFNNEAQWKKLAASAIIAFPVALKNEWQCGYPKNEVAFLKAVRSIVYNDYRIDRNKIYIIADSSSFCVAEQFKKDDGQLVTGIEENNDLANVQLVINSIEKLLLIKSPIDSLYSLYRKPIFDHDQEDPFESLKKQRFSKRVTIEFRGGAFYLLNAVKTGIDDNTYMDISNARTYYNLYVNRFIDDSLSWFVDLGLLRIPRKQEVKLQYQGTGSLIKGEGGGGNVVMLTAGLKYSFHRYKTRPYISFGVGPFVVMIAGGRFKSTSTAIDPSNSNTNIEIIYRTGIQATVESGFDYRLSKRIMCGLHARYTHSSKFRSAGSINAVKGIGANISLGYILGANRLN